MTVYMHCIYRFTVSLQIVKKSLENY